MDGATLCKMYRKTSKSGSEYFVGRLNATARLLILPNKNAGAEGEHDFIAQLVPVDVENAAPAGNGQGRNDWRAQRES